MKFYFPELSDNENAVFTTKKSAMQYIKQLNKNDNYWVDGLYEPLISEHTENDIQTFVVNVTNKKTLLRGLKYASILAGNTFNTPEFD